MIWLTSDTHIAHRRSILFAKRPWITWETTWFGNLVEGDLFFWGDIEFVVEKDCCRKIRTTHKISKLNDMEPVHIAKCDTWGMDNDIILQTNNHVSSKDTLYHLGDVVCVTKGYKNHLEHYLGNLNCKNVHLILGNHDKDITRRKLGHLFKSVSTLSKVKHDKKMAVLCHYPIYSWEKKENGAYHAYGHCHGTIEGIFNVGDRARSMDVGIDNVSDLTGCYRPINIEEFFHICDLNEAKQCNT